MVSMRIESCNSPRPMTLNVSVLAASSTLSETLVSSSFCRRSRRLREVTYCPSRPAKGEVLMVNCMAIVGSSMAMTARGAGVSALVMVSPMVMPSTPATATMSPSSVSTISVRFSPLKENNFVMRTFSKDPFSLAMPTSSPVFSVPLTTRAIASRPR